MKTKRSLLFPVVALFLAFNASSYAVPREADSNGWLQLSELRRERAEMENEKLCAHHCRKMNLDMNEHSGVPRDSKVDAKALSEHHCGMTG